MHEISPLTHQAQQHVQQRGFLEKMVYEFSRMFVSVSGRLGRRAYLERVALLWLFNGATIAVLELLHSKPVLTPRLGLENSGMDILRNGKAVVAVVDASFLAEFVLAPSRMFLIPVLVMFAGLQIMLAVKRCHDFGRSGGWALLLLPLLLFFILAVLSPSGWEFSSSDWLGMNNKWSLPFLVCLPVLLFLMLMPSSVGSNRFGDVSLYQEREFGWLILPLLVAFAIAGVCAAAVAFLFAGA